MGWSHGIDSSRPAGDQEVGYAVEATCEHQGCEEAIDRGLAYACGGEPFGGLFYCNRFFCEGHLTFPDIDDEGWLERNEIHAGLCAECCAEVEAAYREERGIAP